MTKNFYANGDKESKRLFYMHFPETKRGEGFTDQIQLSKASPISLCIKFYDEKVSSDVSITK